MQSSRFPLFGFLAFFVFDWLCLSVVAQERPDAIPADIETIISGGYWKKGQDEGCFRLILKLEGWEHLANRVFLQWVKDDKEKGNVVLKTLPIREINDANWRISAPCLVLKEKSWVLSMNAQATYGDEKRVFRIVPGAGFEYSLTDVRAEGPSLTRPRATPRRMK